MNGPGRTRFGLHLDNIQGLSEKILLSLGRPGIGQLPHQRRGRDGIDGRHIAEGIGNMSCRSVSFYGLINLFHMITPW